MNEHEVTWVEKSGRDSEGAKFHSSVLVHASGRVLAILTLPMGDEYWHNLFFYLHEKHDKETFRFMDRMSAERFAVSYLLLNAPEPGPVKIP